MFTALEKLQLPTGPVKPLPLNQNPLRQMSSVVASPQQVAGGTPGFFAGIDESGQQRDPRMFGILRNLQI